MHTIGNSHIGGFVNGYKISTLEKNWNEDRFDLNHLKDQRKPISEVSIQEK